MKATVTVLGAVEALKDSLVLVELPLLDRDVNADNILPNNASGADVKVTSTMHKHEQRRPRGMGRMGEDVHAMNETLTRLPSCP